MCILFGWIAFCLWDLFVCFWICFVVWFMACLFRVMVWCFAVCWCLVLLFELLAAWWCVVGALLNCVGCGVFRVVCFGCALCLFGLWILVWLGVWWFDFCCLVFGLAVILILFSYFMLAVVCVCLCLFLIGWNSVFGLMCFGCEFGRVYSCL